jgi:molecular chaperone DnaK
LTRAKYEQLVDDLIERSMSPVQKALDDAGVKINEIDDVIMVGGMTRMPRVYEEVKNFFGREPNRSVNPDEVVARGAAIQGGVLTGDVDEVLLLDVTPLSLGIETLGGVMTRLIDRNTTIPTRKSEVFSTAADNQTQVDIHVLQGEREMAVDNKTIGRFILDNIPPAPRGLPQIEVTFDIDANGILNVEAKDKATGKSQNIRIEASSGLSEAEIERMVEDAKKNESEDKEKKARVEARNAADSAVFQAEKQLGELGDKLTPETKSKIEAGIGRVKESLKNENVEEMKNSVEALNQLWHQASAEIYQATGAPGGDNGSRQGAQAGPDNAGGQDDAVDAEFEEVK